MGPKQLPNDELSKTHVQCVLSRGHREICRPVQILAYHKRCPAPLMEVIGVTYKASLLVVDISFGYVPANVARAVVDKSGETPADKVIGINGHDVRSWVPPGSQYAHRQLGPLIPKNGLAVNLRAAVIARRRKIDHNCLHRLRSGEAQWPVGDDNRSEVWIVLRTNGGKCPLQQSLHAAVVGGVVRVPDGGDEDKHSESRLYLEVRRRA